MAAYSLKTRDIINVWNEYFGDAVSSGSYDDVRREDIKRLEVIGLVVGSAEASARNNPTRGYGIEPAVASAIRSFGTNEWAEKAHHIQVGVRDRISQLERSRTLAQTNVTLPSGLALSLTPGAHNDLQRAIIEDFLPRYGYESQILYIGDAANKNLFVNNPAMATLQLPPLNHGELPDIIAYSSLRKWLYFIEAVTSFGPMDSVRRQRLATYARHATVGIIYVTAFPDRQCFGSLWLIFLGKRKFGSLRNLTISFTLMANDFSVHMIATDTKAVLLRERIADLDGKLERYPNPQK